jgi:hypothetical protein
MAPRDLILVRYPQSAKFGSSNLSHGPSPQAQRPGRRRRKGTVAAACKTKGGRSMAFSTTPAAAQSSPRRWPERSGSAAPEAGAGAGAAATCTPSQRLVARPRSFSCRYGAGPDPAWPSPAHGDPRIQRGVTHAWPRGCLAHGRLALCIWISRGPGAVSIKKATKNSTAFCWGKGEFEVCLILVRVQTEPGLACPRIFYACPTATVPSRHSRRL